MNNLFYAVHISCVLLGTDRDFNLVGLYASTSEGTDEETRRKKAKNCAFVGLAVILVYAEKYLLKQECRNSVHRGWDFVRELLEGNRVRCHEQLRMVPEVFVQLCTLLTRRYGLKRSNEVRIEEQVIIFLSICGQGGGNRNAQERFQRSGWTVHKYFHRVLKALTKMNMEWIKPSTRHDVHPYIRNNQRY